MKKIIILVVLMVILGIFSYPIYLEVEKYKSKASFENRLMHPESIYANYKDIYGKYPMTDKDICESFAREFKPPFDSINKLNDVKNISELYSKSIDWRWMYFYAENIDPFSKAKDIFIYFPLYGRETKNIESFIILSTGIDGNQDNYLYNNDTLFIDNWQTKLKLYNSEHPYLNQGNEAGHIIVDDKGKVNFNLINMIFGKKDQLIQVGRVDLTNTIRKRATSQSSI